MFREYLNQVNKRVTSNDPILKANENFIAESLSKLSLFLWENNTREIPINEFYNLIDGKSAYEKDRSKADILINEGLVITRDMRSKNEYISFTYDTLAGFMIGEYLIQKHPDVSYFISKKFIQKIINSNRQHPLFEDIMTSLCLLLPQLKLTSFHELCKKNRLLKFTKSNVFSYLPKFITNRYKDQINFSNYAFEKSISCLFILPAKAVKESDIQLVEKLYFLNNENKKIFYDLSFKTLGDVRHPLNAIFFSRLLASLKMNERDISWSEYIRKKSYNIEEYILEFERHCRSTDSESMIVSDKQHIVSRIIVWFLTSTNKDLRDKSTRALYFYGRKFPNEFSSLAYNSLKFNDPYVWERTLTALYGVVMAEHNSTISDNFRNHILPELSKNIYDLIFKENAQHSTTHILARDYARRIIEIGLIHKPNLFTEKEIKNIRPPYKFGGIRSLGEFDYGDQPYNYFLYSVFSNFSETVFKMLFLLPIGIIIGVLFVGAIPSFSIFHLLPTLLCIFLSGLVVAASYGVIGLIVFWLEDAEPFSWVYEKVLWLLGMFFPPEFFPDFIKLFVLYSPVYAVYSGPAKLIAKFEWSLFANTLIVQIVYLAFFIFFGLLLYNQATKKVNIHGG